MRAMRVIEPRAAHAHLHVGRALFGTAARGQRAVLCADGQRVPLVYRVADEIRRWLFFVTRNGGTDAAHTLYFGSTAASRTTLDSNAHVTGANGTAFYNITNPALTDMYSGTGGLPGGCTWDSHAAVALPGLVFIQTFRPTGTSCTP